MCELGGNINLKQKVLNKLAEKINRLYPQHLGVPMYISINEIYKLGVGWVSPDRGIYYFTEDNLIKLKSLGYTKVNLHLFINNDQQHYTDYSINELLK